MRGFDDSWLRDYRARTAGVSAHPAPSTVSNNRIEFTLPRPSLLMNELRKLYAVPNGYAYKRYRDALSAEIAVLVPDDPWRRPFDLVSVLVRRFSVGVPDVQGAIGGTKPLIDILQVRSARCPSGLGFIVGDDPEHMTLTVECERVSTRAEQRTLVTIERLARTEPVIVL